MSSDQISGRRKKERRRLWSFEDARRDNNLETIFFVWENGERPAKKVSEEAVGAAKGYMNEFLIFN